MEKVKVAKKLYEFSVLLEYHFVVAADSKEKARAEIETYEQAWLNGDFIGVSDVELVEVRKPVSKDLTNEAHIVI